MARLKGLTRSRHMSPNFTADPKARTPEPEIVRSHKDLIVWQKAMDLAVIVYKFTKAFPTSEQYALVAQLRRPPPQASGAKREPPPPCQQTSRKEEGKPGQRSEAIGRRTSKECPYGPQGEKKHNLVTRGWQIQTS
jgi:23S rRNA-intervening sequence protein